MPRSSFKATVVPGPARGPGFGGLDKLAWLMDRAIRIPGTRITIGLDALLGLLPVGGDDRHRAVGVPRPPAGEALHEMRVDAASGEVGMPEDAAEHGQGGAHAAHVGRIAGSA